MMKMLTVRGLRSKEGARAGVVAVSVAPLAQHAVRHRTQDALQARQQCCQGVILRIDMECNEMAVMLIAQDVWHPASRMSKALPSQRKARISTHASGRSCLADLRMY